MQSRKVVLAIELWAFNAKWVVLYQAISPPPIQFQTQNSEAAHGLLLSCCNFKILVFYFALFCKTGSYTAQVGLEIPSQ